MTFEMIYGHMPFDDNHHPEMSATEIIRMHKKGFQNVEKEGKGPWFTKGVKVSKEGNQPLS